MDGSGGWIRTNVPSFKGWCLRPLDYTASACLERARGVEPRPAGWKPAALPLSYARRICWQRVGGPTDLSVISPPRQRL